jgi:TolB-like protein
MAGTESILLFADLVGYTAMMEADPEGTLAAVRGLRETGFEPQMGARGGEVLKRMGDGWILAFPDAAAAVEAALAVQTALAREGRYRLRIGIHTGEMVRDGEDFYGAGVNLTARIEVEAPPGGVMISEALASRLPDPLRAQFRDAGSFRLKNVALPVTLLQWRPVKDGQGGSGGVPTIGVERFAFAPDDAETASAAEDLRDQLIQRLARRTGIRVLDDAMGGAGGADYRLRGRVRIAGRRGRVSLSLALRDTAQPVWNKSYDADPSDIFAFCDGVIDRTDSDLRVQINCFDGDRVAHVDEADLSVSELRSRAASVLHRYGIEDWEQTQRLLVRALALAPGDPMASAMHAETVVALAAARYEPLGPNVRERVERDLDAAVEAAPRSDYILWSRAFFRLHVLDDSAGARADVVRTLALSPAYAHGIDLLGLIDLREGDLDAASAGLTRAIELNDTDPILPYRHFSLAIAELLADAPTAALAAIGAAVQLRPSIRPYHLLMAEAQHRAGDSDSAAASRARADRLPAAPSILALRPPVPAGAEWLRDLLAPKQAPGSA